MDENIGEERIWGGKDLGRKKLDERGKHLGGIGGKHLGEEMGDERILGEERI